VIELPNIPGAEAVAAHFGRWPSFHDAEIVRVVIERGGESRVTIRLVPTEKQIDVDLVFRDIADLHLTGENADRQT